MSDPNAPPTTETPKYMTADDFNKALTARMKAYETSIAKTMEETISRLLESRSQATAAQAEPASSPAAGGGAALPPELDQRFKQFEAQNSRLAKEVEAERKLREAAEAKQRSQEEQGILRAALIAAKVRPEMHEPAMAYLGSRLVRDEGGGVRWRADDGVFASVDEGMGAFLKTPVGMGFLPPVDAGGSGNKPGQGQVGSDGKREYSAGDLGALVLGGFGQG